MKKNIALLILLVAFQFSFAKKVKFSVDMTGQSVHASGVHVMGDFQQLAGLGADYSPDSALMYQDPADTNLYYLFADIPAFAKYEYKYINGDGTYGVEVVEPKARVGYNNNDNRWIYIDSLANDTTMLPAVRFNMTSPAGLTMMRFVVDMTLQTVSPDGVHLGGDFQGWNSATTRLYSFGNSTYEIILYDTLGDANNYNFYNGNAVGDIEFVSGPCAINSMRNLTLNSDTIIAKVCFSACTTCYPLAVSENNFQSKAQLYPNPLHDFAVLEFNDNSMNHQVVISDLSGRTIQKYTNVTEGRLEIDGSALLQGIYIVSVLNDAGDKTTHKLSVEH